MAKKTTQTTHIRTGRGPLIAALLAALVVAAIYMLFSAPARSAASEAHTKSAAAAALVQTNQARLADLKSGKQRSAEQLLIKARELDGLLPQTLDRVKVVSDLDALARRSGLKLDTMTPDASVTTGDATEQAYKTSVTGSMSQIGQFFGALSTKSPLTTISDVAISASADAVTATFTLTTWSVNQPVTGTLG